MWRDEGSHEIVERVFENFGKNSIIKLLIIDGPLYPNYLIEFKLIFISIYLQ